MQKRHLLWQLCLDVIMAGTFCASHNVACAKEITALPARQVAVGQKPLRHTPKNTDNKAQNTGSQPKKTASENQDVTELETIDVVANTDEDTGYAVYNATSATKTQTPIFDTPASIQVIPKTLVNDQQATTLNEAIRNVSGIVYSPVATGYLDKFYIRGFRTDIIYRNGLRLSDAELDMANLETVEVLKGPASMLYGRSEPGGLVNANTRLPKTKPYYALQQQFGSYDFYRTTLDSTGALTADKKLSYRLNLAHQSNRSFRDSLFLDRVFVAPAISWQPTEDTAFHLNLEYKDDDFSYDQGTVAVGNRPANIPISRNFDDPRLSGDAHKAWYLLGLDWSHKFNADWELRNRFSARYMDYQIPYLNAFQGVSPDNQTINRIRAHQNNFQSDFATNLDLNGRFKTGPLAHNILIGVDYQRSDSHFDFTASDFTRPDKWLPINIFKPVYGNINPASVPNDFYHYFFENGNDWFGTYFQDQISLGNKLYLVGGGRYDWADVYSGIADTTDKTPIPTRDMAKANIKRQTDRSFSPRVGIVYQPKPWLSLYANYTESFGANSSALAAEKIFPPQRGTQYEGGIKTEFFDGQLTSTLAFYHLTKSNLLSPNLTTTDPFDQSTVGEATSKGIELDIRGSITPALSVNLAYAYTDAHITKDIGQILSTDGTKVIEVTRGNQGKRLPNVPEHSASLWATYELQYTAYRGLKLGTGIRLASAKLGDNENTFSLPGYVTWDAMLAYPLKVGATKLTAQLNVNNILGQRYYNSSMTEYGIPRASIFPGEPLTIMGSIRLEY